LRSNWSRLTSIGFAWFAFAYDASNEFGWKEGVYGGETNGLDGDDDDDEVVSIWSCGYAKANDLKDAIEAKGQVMISNRFPSHSDGTSDRIETPG
jgi:hypothetical protein